MSNKKNPKPKTFFYVRVPEAVQVLVGKKDNGEDQYEPFGLDKYVVHLADKDALFLQSAAGIRVANMLVELFGTCEPGEVVQVTPDHFNQLKQASETPSSKSMPILNMISSDGQRQFQVPVGRGIQVLQDAINDATQEDPTELAEDDQPNDKEEADDVTEAAPAQQ